MRKILFSAFMVILFLNTEAQVTTIAGDYKVINIGGNGFGDYTRSLILLHEMYNGTLINHNYAIGTITAMRGTSISRNRLDVVDLSTSSAYNQTFGSINARDDDFNNTIWVLKTCLYAGKKYLAVEVPYTSSYHDLGFKFSGSTSSTGENMKCVSYEANGLPVNQNLISNIQDYDVSMGMVETHAVARLNITGNVGIGVINTNGSKLAVKGNIHAQQVTVDMNNWADYVFKNDYNLLPLSALKKYVMQNHHLPEMPSEKEIEKKGLDLGEMNKILTKKVEELTLYLIEKDRQLRDIDQKQQAALTIQRDINKQLQKQLNEIRNQLRSRN